MNNDKVRTIAAAGFGVTVEKRGSENVDMDLRHLQRQRLDVPAAHEHNLATAVPAMQRSRVHDYAMTPNVAIEPRR